MSNRNPLHAFFPVTLACACFSFPLAGQEYKRDQQNSQPDLRSLLTHLEKGDFTISEARRIKAQLTAIGTDAVEPLIEVVRSSPSPWAPVVAVDVLGDIGDKRAVKPLLEILRRSLPKEEPGESPFVLDNAAQPSLRSHIVDALGRIGDRTAVPDLIDLMLNDKDSLVRGRSVAALAKIGDERSFGPLCQAAISSSCDQEMRKELIRAIRESGNIATALPLFFDALAPSRTEGVKINTLKLLDDMASDRRLRHAVQPAAVQPLYALLSTSTDRRVIYTATGTLRDIYGMPLYDRLHWVRFLAYHRAIDLAAAGDFNEAGRAFAVAQGNVVPHLGELHGSDESLPEGVESLFKARSRSVMGQLGAIAALNLLIVEDVQKGVVQKTAAILFFQGVRHGNQSEDKEAIAKIEKAVQAEPKYVLFHVFLGEQYDDAKEPGKAFVEYKKAVAIDPECGPAHWNLAVAYYERGQYQLAIKHCDTAMKRGFKGSAEFLQALQAHRD